MLYTALNWRLIPQAYRRIRTFFLFPLLLVALSSFGWFTVAFHPLPALWSLLGIGGTLACLASLEIAGTFRLTLPALTVRLCFSKLASAL